MQAVPTLVVVSGPPGCGKTTLAHAIARAVGCPAVCRDEIKEGMVHASAGFDAGPDGFVAAPGDELTMRTLPTFFGVLELLLRAGVTTVAEAAFQDRVWRPRLEPLRHLARIRIVQCVVDVDLAWARVQRRLEEDPPGVPTPARRTRRRTHPGTPGLSVFPWMSHALRWTRRRAIALASTRSSRSSTVSTESPLCLGGVGALACEPTARSGSIRPHSTSKAGQLRNGPVTQ
jgi:predicted kinase